MGKRVLITGGAGFIGSHLGDLFLENGYSVRAYDNLDPQVHGIDAKVPDYLNGEIEFIHGDVRDRDSFAKALKGCDILVHFAAAVGVGQSMYEIMRYTSINTMGAATVLEETVSQRDHIERILVASSMSIYGEGLYNCGKCGKVTPRLRPSEQLEERNWEMLCPSCGGTCDPLPTPESKPLYPTSVYAVNKRDHEELFISIGEAYGIPTTAMRFFNVYGERQALSNPYTGVGAIFASRLLNGKPPVIFEDGGQSRDFIHVKDIARGCFQALQSSRSAGRVYNLGTGRKLSILEVGKAIARELDGPVDDFVVRNEYRAGDIRHCYADVTRAREELGFKAEKTFEDGVAELCSWVASQNAVDMVEKATEELKSRGLAR
ncbi:MAG TPA: SDR family NAD(P)-dependent oxidoreductase [Candidatus Sabulitectum sp.]|nr:SDR family NAD(P)-dependent oxidoreductase [Candidatus Sabulitectum sp.]HPF32332.1 SDR family NAD(P)-dependent oxidoreductase [Candidatus Sabulitectum sp.]HPJ27495.1 SDR family NAD(P)-dependent oxidoreductase [Candidatus Sabulitectum sp.]HPR21280.1 SDR family NAD(P)-dependent oxidoreductase [Candidatus Sabulitectum sp.]